MEVVKPSKIIAFWAVTYKAVTGRTIKLKEFYKSLTGGVVRREKILPCYFPTGKGRTDLAVEMMRRMLKFI